MQGKLPRRYHVLKEVARNGCFEGSIPLVALSRLAGYLHVDQITGQTSVALWFEFKRVELDIPALIGHLDVCLELECQRCLSSMPFSVEADFQLMIDADNKLLDKDKFDVVDSNEGFVDIFEIVEDELILSIPLFATHADNTCNAHWSKPEAETESVSNPFAVLQKLKTNH